MFRIGLLATLSALILTGCVSTYGYRTDQGGDYYYAEPSVDYYDPYDGPYSSIGYGYPGGWYGSFGYGFGYSHTPYSHYGFPYGNYGGRHGYPYSYFPHSHRRSPHRRPPHTLPPGTPPPGVIIDNDSPPGTGPRLGDRGDRDGGPWRHLDRRRPPGTTPPPGVVVQNEQRPRRRIMVSQPGLTDGSGQPRMAPEVRRAPVSMPQSAPEPRPRPEMQRAEPAPQRRVEVQERESRPEMTP